jgi:hypothetical protein
MTKLSKVFFYWSQNKFRSGIIVILHLQVGYGPWHLGIQYIRERSWGSLIGRINYVNRLSSGISVSDGIQGQNLIFFTGKTNYSYLGAGYSLDPVFPKLRLAYSFYQNFKKVGKLI